jgi:thioredoxin 1
MNLKTMLTLALALAAIGMAVGCAKEKPASKTETGGATPAVTQEAGQAAPGQVCDTVAVAEPAAPMREPQAPVTSAARMPRLVDLGRGTCIPCKQMAPILKELTDEYKGRAIVEVIDLRERPEAAREYKIKLIPTQVFYDKSGAEVWRHEGFLPKDQIVAKFQELGVKPK